MPTFFKELNKNFSSFLSLQWIALLTLSLSTPSLGFATAPQDFHLVRFDFGECSTALTVTPNGILVEGDLLVYQFDDFQKNQYNWDREFFLKDIAQSDSNIIVGNGTHVPSLKENLTNIGYHPCFQTPGPFVDSKYSRTVKHFGKNFQAENTFWNEYKDGNIYYVPYVIDIDSSYETLLQGVEAAIQAVNFGFEWESLIFKFGTIQLNLALREGFEFQSLRLISMEDFLSMETFSHFQPAPSNPNPPVSYIKFMADLSTPAPSDENNTRGCFGFAPLGKNPPGSATLIGLGTGCQSKHSYTIIAVHEIGHALNAIHEHRRPDAPNYITILTDNIMAGKEFNFAIQNNEYFETPYDLTSSMHYGKFNFGKFENEDDNSPAQTIQFKESAIDQAITHYLSTNDIKDLKVISPTLLSSVGSHPTFSAFDRFGILSFYNRDANGNPTLFYYPVGQEPPPLPLEPSFPLDEGVGESVTPPTENHSVGTGSDPLGIGLAVHWLKKIYMRLTD